MGSTTAVREKPILFSSPMVRAILDGRKTQTRRVVKPQPDSDCAHFTTANGMYWFPVDGDGAYLGDSISCPYGDPGDRLWMRSAYSVRYDEERSEAHWTSEGLWVTTHGRPTRVDGEPMALGRKPAIHMPRWLSAEGWPDLEITGVRVERLTTINWLDACAEGVGPPPGRHHVNSPDTDADREACIGAFRELWDSINGKKHLWASNPWVWIPEFKRVTE